MRSFLSVEKRQDRQLSTQCKSFKVAEMNVWLRQK